MAKASTRARSRQARANHWGLPGMRERVQQLGGSLDIWSKHGAGTESELTIPAGAAIPQRTFGIPAGCAAASGC